jgi:large subunit ribosomal protein L28
MIGHNVSHAKNRTRKIFKPNLHVSRVFINGAYKRMKLCTKCLRRFKAQNVQPKRISSTTPATTGLV